MSLSGVLVHPFSDPVFITQVFLCLAPNMRLSASVFKNSAMGVSGIFVYVNSSFVRERKSLFSSRYHSHFKRLHNAIVYSGFCVFALHSLGILEARFYSTIMLIY